MVFVLVSVAEDAGFEPARAVNPTRFPSERHRPLGESSAPEDTRNARRGGIRQSADRDRSAKRPSRTLGAGSPCGGTSPNSPRAGRQQG